MHLQFCATTRVWQQRTKPTKAVIKKTPDPQSTTFKRIEQSQPFVSQEEIRDEEEGDEGEENSIERKIDLSAVAITSVKERRKPPLKEEEAKCEIKKAERKGLIAQYLT
ncbi:uncharacterized protein LOC111048994 [Nilaparvata lugens]|uniref:uncharacterized protein LOC111048994 n=1 Tax=Nilaparvata lugens TaxID=108931 RepID=UPI00193CB657|nr:uncharacterized protein LOC111048994 [Nilaparvata lugens]